MLGEGKGQYRETLSFNLHLLNPAGGDLESPLYRLKVCLVARPSTVLHVQHSGPSTHSSPATGSLAQIEEHVPVRDRMCSFYAGPVVFVAQQHTVPSLASSPTSEESEGETTRTHTHTHRRTRKRALVTDKRVQGVRCSKAWWRPSSG